MYCVFESTYGYNSSIRLGKIYYFPSKETIVYLLEVNKDLVLLNSKFRYFSLFIKRFLFYKNIRKYITIDDLKKRELGLTTIDFLLRELHLKYNIIF